MQNFSQKHLTLMVARARQIFEFFRQITWFRRNNRALSKFRYRILHYLISFIIKKPFHESQFYINHPSRLNSFHPIVPFLCPLKTSGKEKIADIFRGYRKGRLI